jgi:hypothetical protein
VVGQKEGEVHVDLVWKAGVHSVGRGTSNGP